MTERPPGRLRFTVLGCSSAAPHADWPAAGFLVDWGDTTILLDVGQGVIRRLQRLMNPTALDAVIVGHMHADHYLDLAGFRYLFPWGEAAPRRLPVHLPPGGRTRMDALATAISERPGFFDDVFDMVEYDPEATMTVGPLTVRFVRGRHYVPAWGVVIEGPDGSRLAYTGDTGPSDAVVAALADADLLVIESALRLPTQDDLERGHLTAEEAIDMATRSGARSTLLVHYLPDRRSELDTLCATVGPWIRPAVSGLTVTVTPRTEGDRTAYGSGAPSAAAALDR